MRQCAADFHIEYQLDFMTATWPARLASSLPVPDIYIYIYAVDAGARPRHLLKVREPKNLGLRFCLRVRPNLLPKPTWLEHGFTDLRGISSCHKELAQWHFTGAAVYLIC